MYPERFAMSLLTPVLLTAYHLVAGLSAVLVPLLGGAGPAVAIVVFTAAVRLCLYPLTRAQLRAQAASQKARAALAPAVQKLQRKYKHDPQRVQRETFELYRAHGVSLAPGMRQAFAQMPVFFVVYRLFESSSIAGHRNSLLADHLFGVGLGAHLADVLRTPVSVGHVAVFALLLAAIAAIATWSCIRMRNSASADATAPGGGGIARFMALLPFGTVITAAILPLATGLYLATSTLWTVVERRRLQQRFQAHETADAAVAAAVRS
jgi:YidC/Oxa1 family membrane protein insertase